MAPNKVKRSLIIADIIYALALPFTILPAMFSAMLSDGGSGPAIYVAVYSLLLFPFVLVFSILVPWVFYRLKMLRIALAVLFLPLINFLPILVLVLIPEIAA